MKAFEQDTAQRSCGCIISSPSASGNRVLISKCPKAEMLWSELIRARDAMEEGEGRSRRQGHKGRIDAFAFARESYHDHVFGEGAWRNVRR